MNPKALEIIGARTYTIFMAKCGHKNFIPFYEVSEKEKEAWMLIANKMFETGRACEKISYWAKASQQPDPISDEDFWNLMYCPCMLDDQ